MNAPAWRIWLVAALTLGWTALGVRFAMKQEWVMALLCAALLIGNGVTLWRLLRHGR